MRIVVGVVVGIALLCSSAAAKPLPPPPQLLASAAIGDEAAISPLAQYANQIKPGAGLLLTSAFLRTKLVQEAGATSTEGLDPTAPMYALGVDDGHGLKGLVVVAKVADDKRLLGSIGSTFALTSAGWTAFGPKPLVTAVSTYAFATFPPLPRPTVLAATFYAPTLLAHFKPEIVDARTRLRAFATSMPDSAMTDKLPAMFEGVLAAVGDCDRVVVTIEAAAGTASVDIAFAPRAGTQLGKLVAAQHPSDFSLAKKLVPTAVSALIAGHFESGPYRDAILDTTASFYGSSGAKRFRGPIAEIMATATGEIAMTMSIAPDTGMRMDQVFAVADAKRAERTIAALVASLRPPVEMEAYKLRSTARALPDAAHDGVTVHGYEVAWDTSKTTPLQQAAMKVMNPTGKQAVAIGVVDGIGFMRSTGDGAAQVDVVRGKATGFAVPPAFEGLLANARAHAESLAMIIDFRALVALMQKPGAPPLSGPMMMALGFAGGSAHLRVALPAATIAPPKAP